VPHRILRSKDWFREDGAPIAIERRNPQEPFGLHCHEFSEIVLITSGHGVHVTGKESYPLCAGDAFVIGGSRPHDYHSMERLCLINILFQPQKLGWPLADLRLLPGYHALFTLEPAWRRRHQFRSRLRLSPKELAHVLTLVDNLDQELASRLPGFRFMAIASFMQLAGYLSRCYNDSRDADSRALLRIGAAISHLESHYQESIDIEQLAQIAHMSKRSFMRTFQAATGLSPIAYLIQLRINRAASQLRTSSASVTEIAFRVGFGDSNYFSRQFRKQMSVTPRQYRQLHSSPAETSP
jgi:AraC family L-rhamnose operon transcriptional activator RhaR/AraC family L-rhamnose operon regulatory protein RhaS